MCHFALVELLEAMLTAKKICKSCGFSVVRLSTPSSSCIGVPIRRISEEVPVAQQQGEDLRRRPEGRSDVAGKLATEVLLGTGWHIDSVDIQTSCRSVEAQDGCSAGGNLLP